MANLNKRGLGLRPEEEIEVRRELVPPAGRYV